MPQPHSIAKQSLPIRILAGLAAWSAATAMAAGSTADGSPEAASGLSVTDDWRVLQSGGPALRETGLQWTTPRGAIGVAWLSDMTPSTGLLVPTPPTPTGLRLGWGMAVTPTARIGVDAPLWSRPAQPAPVRLSVAVASREAWLGLRRGQLARFELSASSQVALRARGGTLQLTYQARY